MKKDELYQALKNETGRFRNGSRFMSQRTIMAKYGTNLRALNHAVNLLVKDGLLERKPSIGYFIRNNSKLRQVAYFAPDWPGQVRHDSYSKMKKYLEGRVDLSYVTYDPEKDWVADICRCEADGVIAQTPGRTLTVRQIERLDKLQFPVIFLSRNLEDINLYSADNCPWLDGMLAADHFIKKGHRKLAVIICDVLTRHAHDRVEGFSSEARLHGIPVEIMDCDIQPGEYALQKTYDFLCSLFAGGKPDFSALFVISAESCYGVIRAVNEYGWSIPEDLSIITYEMSSEHSRELPDISFIRYSAEDTAEAIISGFEMLWRGDETKRPCMNIRLYPALIERNSVADLNHGCTSK